MNKIVDWQGFAVLTQMIFCMNAKLLMGTPVHNDLSEFGSMK